MTTTSTDTVAVEVDAPVRAVTLLEDRAQVRRRGTAEVPVGRVRLRVAEVAPALVDRSLQAAVRGEGVRVVDLRVRRRYRLRAEREDAALAERCRGLEAELAALAERRDLLTQQQKLLEAVAGQDLADLQIDAAWGEVDAERWGGEVRKLVARDEKLREELLDLAQRQEDLQETLADLRRRREAVQKGGRRLAADLELELAVESAGEVEVEAGYVVPAACWRPRHTARLTQGEDGERLRFETDASVWQRTGEDWEDVELTFSTARPSRGLEPPRFEDDTVEARRQEEKVVVEERDVEVQEVRATGGPPAKPELPGIDDGGSALALAAPHRATVAANGRPYRVELGSFEAPAQSEHLLVAEVACGVIHKVSAKNAAAQPILAGPVELVADGSSVGRTSVLFVAPDARFDLGFGPDAAIRTNRGVERVEAKPSALSRYAETEHGVVLKLSNIGAEARSFTVRERIPVSEVEQVKVRFNDKATSDGAKLDEANGFVDWRVNLAAGGTETLKLRYTVARRKNVDDAT